MNDGASILSDQKQKDKNKITLYDFKSNQENMNPTCFSISGHFTK